MVTPVCWTRGLRQDVAGQGVQELGGMEMSTRRKVHSEEFKAKVVLEAIRGARTLSEWSSMLSIHSTEISHGKRQFLEGSAGVFRVGG